MTLMICPGFHPPSLTDNLVRSLDLDADRLIIVPSETCPPYSAPHLLAFLNQQKLRDRLTDGVVFLGFSAGVVGAIGAAWAWQASGNSVKAFIAVDGWGIPLYGNFPIHRLSHDAWTHVTSTGLEWLADGFYADPPVPHLELWRSPATAQGWWVNYGKADPLPPPSSLVAGIRTRATAAEVLNRILNRYGEAESRQDQHPVQNWRDHS
ncbi:MAG: hypothetical protein WBA57_01230 [Elainellaceae cyanobacterium]